MSVKSQSFSLFPLSFVLPNRGVCFVCVVQCALEFTCAVLRCSTLLRVVLCCVSVCVCLLLMLNAVCYLPRCAMYCAAQALLLLRFQTPNLNLNHVFTAFVR